jgi:hypothetical protein
LESSETPVFDPKTPVFASKTGFFDPKQEIISKLISELFLRNFCEFEKTAKQKMKSTHLVALKLDVKCC